MVFGYMQQPTDNNTNIEKERECVKSLKAFEQSGTTLNTDKSEARDPRHINPSKAVRQ